MISRRILLLGLSAAACAAPQLVSAQGRDLVAQGADSLPAPPARRTAERVVFTADVRSFQIVRIPIPSELRGADSIAVEFRVEARFSMIGAPRALLTGRTATEDVLVTFGIPGDTRAGAQPVAHAIFRAAGKEIDVPIETRVKPVYRIALTIESELADIQPGERFELEARLANLGNTTDTIRVTVETPEQWQSVIRDSTLVIGPGAAAIRRVRMVIPKNSGTGSFFVRTVATSLGSSAAALTTLSVGNANPQSAPPGPSARMAVGTVGSQEGSSALVGQLAISGRLTNAVYVDGRASTQPAIDAAGIRGLARVGSYVTTPHLAAWNGTWRFNAGSSVADFGDVVGVNAGGRGASLEFDNDHTSYEVLAARPLSNGAGYSGGSIIGGQYASRIGFAEVGGSASRMRTPGLYARSLSAYGLDLAANTSESVRLSGTVAYRDFDAGTGMGWAARLEHRKSRNHAELRLVHAPGGSAAFARAENELAASFSRAMTDRYDVAASYFKATDTDIAASNVRSHVVRLVQQYRLTDRVQVRADAHVSEFDVHGDPFSFSNGEKRVGAGATATYGWITYSTDLAVARLSRGIQTNDVDATDTGGQYSWRGTLFRPLTSGSLQLEASYEHNDAGTGYVSGQTLVTARANRAQLPFGPRNLAVDAEIGYNRWAGIRSFTSYRAGATYLLPYGTEISAALERNPLLYTASGKRPVVFALRVEKSIGLPRLMTGGAEGVVFQDYNGNGRQDDGEAGMPNIVVRRGSASAVTGRDGSYRFWETGRGRPAADPVSLPYGWIVNDKSTNHDIALMPTTSVEVVLQPGAAERLRNVNLTNVVVMARDEFGRSWIARRTSSETAVFEALPVGSYEIDLDFAALAEPLRIDGPTPRVAVTRETSTRIVIAVAGRPLRFKPDQQENR